MLGEMNRTNFGLVDYGIMQEASDIRAHVGVLAGVVYVFKTEDARNALNANTYQIKPAFQPGVMHATAEGVPMPVGRIQHVPVNAKSLIAKANFLPSDSTSVKGAKAVWVVTSLLRAGWFPMLGVSASEEADTRIQISGIDVIVTGRWRIQVKCDWKAGIGPGCTGNVYLQLRERNPFGAK